MNIKKHIKAINVFALLLILLLGYLGYVKYESAELEDKNKALEKQLEIANEKIKTQKNELNELKRLLDFQTNVDVDYEIEANVTDSNVAVVAIHGGKIEKGTTELAYALASHNNYNYYSFQGLKSTDNFSLHVPSDKFAEC